MNSRAKAGKNGLGRLLSSTLDAMDFQAAKLVRVCRRLEKRRYHAPPRQLGMPRSLDRKKLIHSTRKVNLEPFERKLWNGDRWAIIRSRRGKEGEMDWVETLLGVRGNEAHAHMGSYIDGTRMFLQGRGVLKGLVEYAEDARTGRLLDRISIGSQGGEGYEFRWRVKLNKETRVARIVDVMLVRRGDVVTSRD